MIVCSCNVLSDHDVRDAVNASSDLPRNAKQLRDLGVGYCNCAPSPEVRMLKSMQAQVSEARG